MNIKLEEIKLRLSDKCFLVRKYLQYTQKQYGERLGCSQGMVSLIECGYNVKSYLRDYIENDYDVYRESIRKFYF